MKTEQDGREYIRNTSMLATNDAAIIEKVASETEPNEVYAVKEVDRRLSRPFIRPFFTTCDVGGRCGIDAIPFAYSSDSSFLLDVGKEALDTAKNIATRLGLKSKMVFVRCSALNLPFQNEVFNLTSSFSVLDHISGKNSCQKAIEEMARVTCNFGYVVVTVPNKLFVIGDIARKIIQFMGDPFLETHFAPKEIEESMLCVGLTPFLFDAKYPTTIGKHITSHHLPRFVMTIPAYILQPFLRIWEKIFLRLEKSPFKMFGARMGYASQKRSIGVPACFPRVSNDIVGV